jgi:hypothetical protein
VKADILFLIIGVAFKLGNGIITGFYGFPVFFDYGLKERD